MKLITKNIQTVGQLQEALKSLPKDATLNPFGSPVTSLVYDEKTGTAYLDEDFSWTEDQEPKEDLEK